MWSKMFEMGGWKTWTGLFAKVLVMVVTELFGAEAGGHAMEIINRLGDLFIIWGIAHKIDKAAK